MILDFPQPIKQLNVMNNTARPDQSNDSVPLDVNANSFKYFDVLFGRVVELDIFEADLALALEFWGPILTRNYAPRGIDLWLILNKFYNLI